MSPTRPSPGLHRAAVRLGLLAVALLVAGVLPWATGARLDVRLIALPLLLAGALLAAVALRVLAAPAGFRAPSAAVPLRPTAPAGASGASCSCAGGGCAAAEASLGVENG